MTTQPIPELEARIVIAFDGETWNVRHLDAIEYDSSRDFKVYHCDRPISNGHPTLADVPQVAELLSAERKLLVTAWYTLRSYEHGNSSGELAGDICRAIEKRLNIDPEHPPALEKRR